jgi:competence protein ComEA
VVHVVGAVAAPGVVRLPFGARVVDALSAAGGAAPDADLARVNLARVLVDGEQIQVPRPGDPAPEAPTAGAAPGDGTLDLNTASLAQLDGLPGVGPVLAQRIVDRRPFASVDELDEVSGIGQALLERLRPLVHA